jgi:hypothetical protein
VVGPADLAIWSSFGPEIDAAKNRAIAVAIGTAYATPVRY